MQGSARDYLFHGSVLIIDAHVEVEDFLPHGNQKAEMLLLSGVFLSDLQFDGFVGVVESGKQWGYGLANLKIDWAIFDLNDYVVVELAVERVKVVVSRFGAVVFQ